MRKKLFFILSVTFLSAACWLYAVFAWGNPGILALYSMAIGFWIACGLGAAALVWTLRRASASVWIAAGLFVLGLLLLTTSFLIEEYPVDLAAPLAITLLLIPTILPALALVIAAMLLYTGLNAYLSWRQSPTGEDGRVKQAGRTVALTFVLSLLLLFKSLHNLYWLMIWDSTTDSLEYFWLVLPILGVIFAGVVLLMAISGKWKLAGLSYALLAPALVIAVSAGANQVDFRQLTEDRAGKVSHAIESYYARESRYPNDLQQLTPRYLLSIPEPVIIYGQDWCYQGSENSYYLGYVDREHWSSPYLIGQMYKTSGEAPDPDSICQEEIAALRQSKPGYYLADGE